MYLFRSIIAAFALFGLASLVFADSAELDDFRVPFSLTGGPGAGIWETAVDSPIGPFAMERLAAPAVGDETGLGTMQAADGVVTATVPAGATSPNFILAYEAAVGTTVDLRSFDSFALRVTADEPFRFFGVDLVAQVPGVPLPGGQIFGAHFTSEADEGGLLVMPFSSFTAGPVDPDFANIIAVEFEFSLSEPGTVTVEPASIPEPSTFALAAIGLVGLLGWGRRKQ